MLSLALSLFPDNIDGLDSLIEQSMPLFALWLLALGFLLSGVVVHKCVVRFKERSPVEKILRRRFG
jgi:hypothetical protein